MRFFSRPTRIPETRSLIHYVIRYGMRYVCACARIIVPTPVHTYIIIIIMDKVDSVLFYNYSRWQSIGALNMSLA